MGKSEILFVQNVFDIYTVFIKGSLVEKLPSYGDLKLQ